MSSIAVEVVALALQRLSDGKYLLARRGPQETGAGHWEFPGGKVEANEHHKQALAREIDEELTYRFDPDLLVYVTAHTFQYPQRLIHLHLYKLVIPIEPIFTLTEHDLVSWCYPSDMKDYSLSPGDIFFIDKLL